MWGPRAFTEAPKISDMKLSKQTKDKIRALPIISVAEKLGMHLYGMGKLNRRCVCPFHDDHEPSLHLNATKNIFKCFSCGKGGDVIGLVMQVENLKYLDACQWLINEFQITLIDNCPAALELCSLATERLRVGALAGMGTQEIKEIKVPPSVLLSRLRAATPCLSAVPARCFPRWRCGLLAD